MTAHEFAALRPFLQNEPDRVEVARLVFVDGLTHEAAGQRFGLSRANVTSLIAMVTKAFERQAQAQAEADEAVNALLPPGWERATVVAPRPLLDKLRADVEKVLRRQAEEPPKKGPGRASVPG